MPNPGPPPFQNPREFPSQVPKGESKIGENGLLNSFEEAPLLRGYFWLGVEPSRGKKNKEVMAEGILASCFIVILIVLCRVIASTLLEAPNIKKKTKAS